jgi:hypothetical protein
MAIGKPSKEDTNETPVAKPHTVKRIENNTSCILTLPCTDGFPLGIRLVPGLNSVPLKYLSELNDFEVEGGIIRRGAKEVQTENQFPGRKALEMLQQPVRIVRATGEHFGPQITIYELGDKAVEGRDDGPPAPPSLPQNKDAAMAIVRATTDRAALKRWSEQGNGEAQQAAGARLNGLVFNPTGIHGG